MSVETTETQELQQNETESQPMVEEVKPEEQKQTNPEQTKTFTQAEIDAIVQARIARERDKYKDYEDLKAKAEAYEEEKRQREEAEMTEAEKARKEAERLKAELESLRKQQEQNAIDSAIEEALRKENVKYIDQAKRLADLSSVKYEDGKVIGVEEVVKNLLAESPFLKVEKQREIGEPSNTNPVKPDKSAEELLEAAAQKARMSGRMEDKLAYVELKRKLSQ